MLSEKPRRFCKSKWTLRKHVPKPRKVSRSLIPTLRWCLAAALLAGNFSASVANASESTPAPLSNSSALSTSLSFVGMTDLGGIRILQATAPLTQKDQIRIRLAFPDGTSDRAIKMQIVSRKTLPGSSMTLISLKLSAIDLWNLTPADLSSLKFIELGHQAISTNSFQPVRSIHWINVSPMGERGLSAGVLSGFRLQGDGTILVQYKKSSSSSVTEPTLL